MRHKTDRRHSIPHRTASQATGHSGDHHDHADEHDLGFAHDLPRLIGRRGVLAGAGMVMAAPLAAAECTALPWETAGPFPADGSNSKAGQLVNVLTQSGVLRQDIRSSFAGYEGTAEGVTMELELQLLDAAGCTPLAGAAIYIWHCDAVGHYSLYDDTSVNFLRGVGVADAEGRVRFTTIVPGCYPSRWPHIHFEVFETPEAAVAGEASLLTAQIALPEVECAEVYKEKADIYTNGVPNLGRNSLTRDMVFRDNTPAQIAQQTATMSGDPETGYSAHVTVPVDPNAERAEGGFFGRLFGRP